MNTDTEICTARYEGRQCGGRFKRGTVLHPVWGNRYGKPRRGDTIYKVGSIERDCYKCERCGHSISMDGVIHTDKALPPAG